MNYFEDIEIGEIRQSGPYTVTKEEAVEFASRYDPQELHLSEEAAARSHFGRLSLSGMNTAAIVMRLFVDCPGNVTEASLAGIGIDELRWLKPVYPGDTLTLRIEAVRKRRSRSRPDTGTAWHKVTAFNQHGGAVISLTLIGLVALRDPQTATGSRERPEASG